MKQEHTSFRLKDWRPRFGLGGLGLSGILLALLAGASGLSSISCRRGGGTAQPAPVPVVVATAQQRDMPLVLRTFGQVQAYNTIQVTSQVGGILSEAFFRDGQTVRKGQKLIQIDPRTYEASLKQAQANLAKAQAQAQLAQIEAHRVKELLARQAATRDEVDTAVANAAAAVATAEADQAAVDMAALQLSYTQINSPVDGIIGQLLVNEGNVVKANDTALVTINQVHPVYVAFTLPQQNLLDVQRHQAQRPLPVLVSMVAQPQVHERGELTFIDNQVDVATGTFRMRGTFVNDDLKLWPGLYLNVILVLDVQRAALVVPGPAIQTLQEGRRIVFAVSPDHKASVVPVEVERFEGGLAIVRKGLQAGQTVVTDGQLRLEQGSTVQIRSTMAMPPMESDLLEAIRRPMPPITTTRAASLPLTLPSPASAPATGAASSGAPSGGNRP